MSNLSVPSDLRSDSLKTERLVKQSLRPSDFPATFRANTSEEETILQYTENFRRQYVNLFPHRAPLLLRPQNECGIAKLVCTYVRPFQLSALDNYDLEKCAKFVAEFVEYLPLKAPSKLPSALHSPYTVVQLRAGDCFDMAILLTSLLRGNGYDAYVVSGYAPRWVTERDLTEQDIDLSGAERPDNQVLFGNPKYSSQPPAQTQTSSSLLLEQKAKEMEVKKQSGEDNSGGQWPRDTETGGIHSRAFGKYVIKFPTVHVSKFLEQQKAGKQSAGDGAVDESNKDPFFRRRVHAWVLVLPNRRPESVKEPVFVEPSTGALYPTSDLDCPYERVESVWSDRNLWVNLQSDKTPIQKLNYQLANPNAWEFLFFSRNASSEIDAFNTAAIAAANAAALAERNAKLLDSSDSGGELPTDDQANGNTNSEANGEKADASAAAQGQSEQKDGAGAAPASSDDDSADALRDAPEAVIAATGDPEAIKEAATAAGTDATSSGAAGASEEKGAPEAEQGDNRAAIAAKPVNENGCGVSRVDGWRAKPPVPHQVDISALQRASGMKLQVLEPPMSWVTTIPITKEAAAIRLPDGRRVEKYKRCKVEYFADFFDGHFGDKAPLTQRDPTSACSRVASVAKMAEALRANGIEPASEDSDGKLLGSEVAQYVGLKKRVLLYDDDECTSVRETQETFAHRKDKLVYRIRIPSQSLVHQVYEQGRARGLKSYTEVAGTRRCFEFYPLARVDGMVKREEILGVKIVEMYQDRDDRLLYRSVAFDTAPGSPKRAKGFCVAVGPEQTELPVRKITEKFSRNETVHAEEDVRKRTHFILEGQIRLDFHYGQHQVSSSQLLFDKSTESCHGHRMDPMWKAPTPSQIREQLQQLLFVEKALMGKVKDRERDMLELMQQLMKDASHASLSKSIYHRAWEESLKAQKGGTDSGPATARIDEDPEDNEKANAAASPLMGRALAARGSVSTENGVLYQDYLAPFLAQFPAGKPLSRKQALQVKEECLRALKERLLERANIIQAHLDSEQEQLRQRQAQHERTVAALSAAAQAQGNNAPDNPHTQALAVENAEFSHFSDDAMFRINILQARLSRHEEQSLQKYAQLDARLWADPRLRLSDSKP